MWYPRPAFARLAALSLALHCGIAVAAERVNWNADWGFAAAETDHTWRPVHLPHDWSSESAPQKDAPDGGYNGFFPAGSAWYRKVFRAPEDWGGRTVSLLFEGVYGDTVVFVNDRVAGRAVHGYTPLEVDLTEALRLGAENTVLVRVDNSAQPNARWYTGSGIYRPVWLQVKSPVHIATDGVFVSTSDLGDDAARLRVETTIRNSWDDAVSLELETVIEDAEGNEITRLTSQVSVPARGGTAAAQAITVPSPRPWSPDSPALYRAVTHIRRDSRPLDFAETDFGIRTIRVSSERGFELNGVPLELNGANVHHDNGVLGAAAFAAAESRKAGLVKRAGFNAVRTAHNPPSTAFLKACDRLGLLVVNEIFDGWARAKTKHDYSRFFAEWWRKDLDAWVMRDRNHPSVVMWSIGNEMFERGGESGRRFARELSTRIRELDETRPVTAGVNGMGKTGDWTQLDPLFAALDVAGLNYELGHHESDHARLPARVMMAAESYQNEVFENWRVVTEKSYVIGDFVWSGMDYLGESGIGRVFEPQETMLKHWEASMWPWHGAACGDIDLTGWRKPISHYRNIVWDRGEKIYAAVVPSPAAGGKWNLSPWAIEPAIASWTWEVRRGTPLAVDVYSRCETVRLELNGKVVAERTIELADQFRARFDVPYEPGTLVAIGLTGGREVARHVLRTADVATRFQVDVDRASLAADGEDLAFITIQAVDDAGVWNATNAARVNVHVEGAASLAGLGSADLTSLQSYQSNSVTLFQGRALLVVRARKNPGEAVVRVDANDFKSSIIKLNVSPVER